MNVITINEQIRCVEATAEPLSADVGIVRAGGVTWLYDVGNGPQSLVVPEGPCRVVLSHFHADHVGNLARVPFCELYVSKETQRHVLQGTVVDRALCFGDLRIFPLPSSHAKGCLGLEVGGEYAFVGDALYSRVRDGFYVYNAQKLLEEIETLRGLRAPRLLVSHFPGMVREKDEVLTELEAIYALRDRDCAEILVAR